MWVASGGSVAMLSAKTGRLQRAISDPTPTAMAADSAHVWVANTGLDAVTELNAVNGNVVREISAKQIGLSLTTFRNLIAARRHARLGRQ